MFSRLLHYAARFAILYGFAGLLLHLYRRGTLRLYIESGPAEEAIRWSALFLYLMSIYQLYLMIINIQTRRQAGCECEVLPPFRFKAFLLYSLFALPLVLSYTVGPR